MRERSVLERCGCHYGPSTGGEASQGPRPFRLPGDRERYGRARPWDVLHLRWEAMLDVTHGRVEARAELDVTARDPAARTLALDAVDFDIASVERVDGGVTRVIPYGYDGVRLVITLGALQPGERATVAVTYRATPRRGLYFLSPDATVTDRPWQVWSQCQDEDARHWIPCHDFPNVRMTTEMVVHAPTGWTVLSNGSLVSHTPGAVTDRWHWRQDQAHASYLVTLVAGTFTELDGGPERIPVKYYVDPGREADGLRAFGRTPAMIRHFESVTGTPYPWVKYTQVAVHDFIFGGMENTSATTVTDRILLDARAALDATADDLVAHELAHQWFGDLVTCRDWSHAWLNEGFATYFEHVDWELKGGRDAYLHSLKDHAEAYFGEDGERYRRPVVCNTYGEPIDLFDRHLYEKGGWVLHMLRAELGDGLFWQGVQTYLARHRGGVVETRDLLRAMEDTSGRSLEAFFEQWLYRGGYPEVEVEVRHDADAGLLTVTVRQTQKTDALTPVFQFSLGVAVVTDHGAAVTHALAVREETQTFTLVCPGAPRRVVIDPEGTVLMKLAQKLPRDLLLDTLARDSRAIARWRAAAALGRLDDARTVAALGRAVQEDGFWGVAAEAARALGEIRSEPAQAALVAAVAVENPRVRRAVVRALGEFRTDTAARVLTDRLATGDASYLVESELARAAGRTRRPGVFEALHGVVDRPSWRDVIRCGVIDGLAALRDARALVVVEPYVNYGHAGPTRRAAVGALADLADLAPVRRAVRERLEGLLDDRDPHLVIDVLHALARMKDPEAAGAMGRCGTRAGDGRVRRAAREALRGLNERAPGDGLQRVRDDVDHVRDEARALRDELARVRALLDAQGALPGRRATSGDRSPGKKPPAKKPPVKKKLLGKKATGRKPGTSRRG